MEDIEKVLDQFRDMRGPDDAPHVAVGALNPNGSVALFSNVGAYEYSGMVYERMGRFADSAAAISVSRPSTLPSAPTAKTRATEPSPTRRVAIALAPITRPRLGTSVNVVSPLRWLHSLVTARIAIIGKITDIGNPIALAKLS